MRLTRTMFLLKPDQFIGAPIYKYLWNKGIKIKSYKYLQKKNKNSLMNNALVE